MHILLLFSLIKQSGGKSRMMSLVEFFSYLLILCEADDMLSVLMAKKILICTTRNYGRTHSKKEIIKKR